LVSDGTGVYCLGVHYHIIFPLDKPSQNHSTSPSLSSHSPNIMPRRDDSYDRWYRERLLDIASRYVQMQANQDRFSPESLGTSNKHSHHRSFRERSTRVHSGTTGYGRVKTTTTTSGTSPGAYSSSIGNQAPEYTLPYRHVQAGAGRTKGFSTSHTFLYTDQEHQHPDPEGRSFRRNHQPNSSIPSQTPSYFEYKVREQEPERGRSRRRAVSWSRPSSPSLVYPAGESESERGAQGQATTPSIPRPARITNATWAEEMAQHAPKTHGIPTTPSAWLPSNANNGAASTNARERWRPVDWVEYENTSASMVRGPRAASIDIPAQSVPTSQHTADPAKHKGPSCHTGKKKRSPPLGAPTDRTREIATDLIEEKRLTDPLKE